MQAAANRNPKASTYNKSYANLQATHCPAKEPIGHAMAPGSAHNTSPAGSTCSLHGRVALEAHAMAQTPFANAGQVQALVFGNKQHVLCCMHRAPQVL